MEQRQMEQTLTGLLLTATEQLRDLEPYGNWQGKPEGIENQEKILRMANVLCELWGIGSGVRTILEDLRLEKIVGAIAALGFTDEEVQNINEFSRNTQSIEGKILEGTIEGKAIVFASEDNSKLILTTVGGKESIALSKKEAIAIGEIIMNQSQSLNEQ